MEFFINEHIIYLIKNQAYNAKDCIHSLPILVKSAYIF